MADDDANLPDAYDLVPVDHTPQFADAPVPKAGQTVQQPNVMGDISSMPGKVASAVGDVTGVSDAYKAATGQMTPEEAQMFALGALPMLAGGPEAKAVGEVASDIAPEVAKGIRAFHGSPYDFNQFDLSKIGTGEGAQAYGHGLYLAENEQTAKAYKLAGQTQPAAIQYQGTNIQNLPRDQYNALPQLTKESLGFARDDASIAQAAQNATARGRPDIADELMRLHSAGDLHQGYPVGGHMYEVNINADPEHFLDWDKPLSEQSQHVKDAVAKVDASIAPTAPNISQIKDPQIRGVVKNALKQNDGQVDGLELMIDNDSGLYNTAVAHAKRNGVDLEKNDMRASDYVYQQAKGYIDALHASQNLMGDSLAKVLGVKGADMMQAGPAAARLRDAGIPGIKYLDQGSRGQTTWTAIHPQGGINDFPNEQQARAFVAKNPEYSLEAPKQTSNYVVFNDKLIDIVKKYGLAGLVAGGASHFSTVPVDHQPDFPDQNGMADGGAVDDATDPTNSIAPLATALNQAVPNFDPEAAGFRPSTNIEDVRNKPLWRKAIEVITRKPLPGDLTTYAKGGSVKATKTQANYRGGTAKKRCGICSMFVAPSGCTAVRGVISARALCDFFERKAQERANGGRVDVANIEHEPSEAQKEAGNYAKDHVRVRGLDITIENAKGGYRRGVGHDGKPWSVKMPAHYGYIKGTIGKDKDHVDVYLGPHLKSPTVFVVDQVDHETKKFDEHKAFLGFASPRQVMDTYQKAFSDGKAMQRLGHLTGMSIEEFKNWLATGDMKKKADDHFADAVKIDATHDGPWMSCMSIDGATMYRNKNIPATANIKGKTVDVDDMLLHHEVPERDDLEKLIAEFKVRFKREPNKNERKAIYLKAHNRSGTPNERAHAKKIGVDWKAWSAWCRGEESKIEKMKFTNQPKDADVKPIPHSHGELEAMDHASAA